MSSLTFLKQLFALYYLNRRKKRILEIFLLYTSHIIATLGRTWLIVCDICSTWASQLETPDWKSLFQSSVTLAADWWNKTQYYRCNYLFFSQSSTTDEGTAMRSSATGQTTAGPVLLALKKKKSMFSMFKAAGPYFLLRYIWWIEGIVSQNSKWPREIEGCWLVYSSLMVSISTCLGLEIGFKTTFQRSQTQNPFNLILSTVYLWIF